MPISFLFSDHPQRSSSKKHSNWSYKVLQNFRFRSFPKSRRYWQWNVWAKDQGKNQTLKKFPSFFIKIQFFLFSGCLTNQMDGSRVLVFQCFYSKVRCMEFWNSNVGNCHFRYVSQKIPCKLLHLAIKVRQQWKPTVISSFHDYPNVEDVAKPISKQAKKTEVFRNPI